MFKKFKCTYIFPTALRKALGAIGSRLELDDSLSTKWSSQDDIVLNKSCIWSITVWTSSVSASMIPLLDDEVPPAWLLLLLFRWCLLSLLEWTLELPIPKSDVKCCKWMVKKYFRRYLFNIHKWTGNLSRYLHGDYAGIQA